MGDLFRRSYRLVVEDIAIEGLDILFDVEKTLKKQPNTASIQIFNLDADRRQRMEERGGVRAILEAGYEVPEGTDRIGHKDRSMIFSGDLYDVRSEHERADWITYLEVGDGITRHRRARIQKNFTKGTSLITAIRACAEALGVGLGNLNSLTSAEFPGVGAVLPSGSTASGSAAEELDGLLTSAGLEYSIQNGVLQILTRRQHFLGSGKDNDFGSAVLLNPATGLVGSPGLSSDLTLTAESLMIPDIYPGRKIKVESDSLSADILAIQSRGAGRRSRSLAGFSGFFRVNRAKYVGDSAGKDWNIKIEGEPLFKKAA